MAVRNIISDLITAANSSKARDYQYRNHAIEFTFNIRAIQDTVREAILDEIIRQRSGYTYADEFTQEELDLVDQAVRNAVAKVYTDRTIGKVHRQVGYKVFSGGALQRGKIEQSLAAYTGYQTDRFGRVVTKTTIKLACAIIGRIANAGGTVVMYAGSMESFSRKNSNHRRVLNILYEQAIRQALIEIKKGISYGSSRTQRSTRVGEQRRVSQLGGRSRAIRLHGPNATKLGSLSLDTNQLGTGTPTGFTEADDTSVPVVSMIDALKGIKARGIVQRAADVGIKADKYNLAYKETLAELDLEFSVNNESISDIINFNKEIVIKMHQGGDIHQRFMKHADKENVKKILELIQDRLIQKNSDPEYQTSKAPRKRYEEIAIASIMQMFNGTKLDMRRKVNQQLVNTYAKRLKEKSKGKGSIKYAGKVLATKTMSSTRRKSSRRRMAQTASTAANNQGAVALKELLNQVLPDMLLGKMQAPALVNRTGRFRNSAEVTNTMIGPRGGVQVDYTYQRNPYEVFEPGGRLYTPDRNPQKIIGETIREVAQQIMGRKFIKTRRV